MLTMHLLFLWTRFFGIEEFLCVWTNSIELYSFCFVYFQSLPVLYLVLSTQRFILYDLIAFPGKHIYPDNKVDEGYYDICSQQIDSSFKQYFFKMFILFVSFYISMSWPLYMFLSHGVKSTLIQAKFPFVDENSNAEFLGNFSLELLIVVYGISAYFGLEICVTICTDFFLVSRSLLEYKLRRMLIKHSKKLRNNAELFASFQDIIRHVEEFDRFS